MQAPLSSTCQFPGCGLGIHFNRLSAPTYSLTGPVTQRGVWCHDLAETDGVGDHVATPPAPHTWLTAVTS